MTQSPSIANMVSQSREVLTKPSVTTFERFEKSGDLTNAVIYVAIAAAITGLFGLFQGVGAFLSGIIGTLIGFVVFAYLVYWFGKRQGGTGTFDEVAYTFALFWAPLAVVFSIVTVVLVLTIIGIFLLPLVGIAAIAANIYFAYLAVQSSMNLDPGGKTWGVLILAGLGAFVFNVVVAAITTTG